MIQMQTCGNLEIVLTTTPMGPVSPVPFQQENVVVNMSSWTSPLQVCSVDDDPEPAPTLEMRVTPFRNEVAIVRGCRSVALGGYLAEEMLNTHGTYPGMDEQIRVLRLPGSQLFVQRLEKTDKKLLENMCLRNASWSVRWQIMVRALAAERLHGCLRLPKMCEDVLTGSRYLKLLFTWLGFR